MATTSGSVTREEIVARAAALAPALKERASRTEEARQIPAETVRDVVSAGLLRVGTPPKYGGNGLDYDVSYDIAGEIGRACGSTAWCTSVWTSHNWIMGHFPREAQDEYFAAGPDVLSSSAYNPTQGKAEPVDGGIRLSGRWDFSSGSDAGAWVTLGALGPQGDLFALIPRSDYEIIDTWYTAGLRGTGSKDIVVKDAFVPAHRTLAHPWMSIGDEPWNGWEAHKRPSYRVPLACIMPFTLAAPLIGIAQGGVDEFMAKLVGTSGRGRTAESVAVQLRLAESSAEVDAARLLMHHCVGEMLAKGERGDAFTPMERARYARDYGYVAKLCVQAVNRLFDASGGHALFTSEAIQRFHRDAHAASHQTALYWDPIAETYGKMALGVPVTPGFF